MNLKPLLKMHNLCAQIMLYYYVDMVRVEIFFSSLRINSATSCRDIIFFLNFYLILDIKTHITVTSLAIPSVAMFTSTLSESFVVDDTLAI